MALIDNIVEIINFLNKKKVNYNLVEEHDQIRIELDLVNAHETQGDYIVITKNGVICMNLFEELELKHVFKYIEMHHDPVNDVNGIKERMELILDDLNVIRRHTPSELLNLNTEHSDSLDAHFNNIEIACDLDDDECLCWNRF